MFLHGITDPDFATFMQIQKNKNEGLEEAVLTLRKKDRVPFAKRIERKREYGLRKKARRIGSFWKVDETELSPQGFINVPDQIWRNKLSKDEQDFVTAYNSKKWHGELT
eukprot:4148349-Ditylum_brightwellii.AAC.1